MNHSLLNTLLALTRQLTDDISQRKAKGRRQENEQRNPWKSNPLYVKLAPPSVQRARGYTPPPYSMLADVLLFDLSCHSCFYHEVLLYPERGTLQKPELSSVPVWSRRIWQ